MSDRRHTQRPALPEGYQFGDAALQLGTGDHSFIMIGPARIDWWRAPHENAAAQLRRQAALNAEVTSLVAAHVHGDAIARDYFDTFESQRTGDETV